MPLSILTCSEYFADLALNELNRRFSNISVLYELSPGCILLHSPLLFDNLTRPWRHRLPIYLHHLCPVDYSIRLRGNLSDLALLKKVVKRQTDIKYPLIVQPRILSGSTHPSDNTPSYSVDDLIAILNKVVRPPANTDKTPKGKVLSVVIVPNGNAWQAYLGVSWASQNLSPWPGGVRPPMFDMPNRAGYKLLEALEVFKIKLRAGDRALDLGAAPGAWTLVLRQHGMHVTAVSPGWLYSSLQKDPLVHHWQMRAETYLHNVKGEFDFIVNDMRMTAQDSARLMIGYAQYLRTHGIAVMTLKLRQRNRRRMMDHSFRILRKAYRIIKVRQLASNRKEVTLFLRKLN